MSYAIATTPGQPCPPRAIDGLTDKQADIVMTTLRGWNAGLSVERHDSYDGQRSIIVSGRSDAVIVVDRDAVGMRVSCMRDDAFQPGAERFRSLVSALDAIKAMTIERL